MSNSMCLGVKFLYEHTLMNKTLCKGKIHNVNWSQQERKTKLFLLMQEKSIPVQILYL